jgi:hypothetical protein
LSVKGPGKYDPQNYFGNVGYHAMYKHCPSFKFGAEKRPGHQTCAPGTGQYSPGFSLVKTTNPAFKLGN